MNRKARRWITAGVLCALCCAGAQQASAQKMYKEGEAIVLDCGLGSGFPQGAVEMQKGKKIAAGTPSDTQGPMANNTGTGTINATVYQKLEIAKEDGPTGLTWASAYVYCQQQGEGWRLPTQRELMLIWIFREAVVGLGGATFASAYYWTSTEYTSTSSWDVYFPSGGTYDTYKTTTNRSTRCVREMD